MHHVARKRFGQHFLHDKQVIQRIVSSINPSEDQHLVEIGPGQGALTLPLLKAIGQIDVIELDWDLIPALKTRCLGKGALIVNQGDALEFDFTTVLRESEQIRVVGNLPYNISTPLIFHLLEFAQHIKDMHFMLQKEVVERMAAGPDDDAYGRLSVMVQYHCQVISLFNVGPEAFYPPPQVDSSVVRLIPHQNSPHRVHDYKHFSDMVRVAFSHRRKTLRNCLKTMMTDADWNNTTIDSQLRPERLSVGDFVLLSNLTAEKPAPK